MPEGTNASQDKPKSYQASAMLVSLISKTAHKGRHNLPEGCLWNTLRRTKANTMPITYERFRWLYLLEAWDLMI